MKKLVDLGRGRSDALDVDQELGVRTKKLRVLRSRVVSIHPVESMQEVLLFESLGFGVKDRNNDHVVPWIPLVHGFV